VAVCALGDIMLKATRPIAQRTREAAAGGGRWPPAGRMPPFGAYGDAVGVVPLLQCQLTWLKCKPPIATDGAPKSTHSGRI
jgi:hypothetical protein